MAIPKNSHCLKNTLAQAEFEINGNSDVPFIHKFETEQNKYVYDVNTMHIVGVEPIVWDIISDFGHLSKEDIVSRYSGGYNPDKILSACGEILNARQKKKLFLSNRPEIVFPFTEEDIRQKLADERMILTLNVTEDCNFRCAYCVYSGQYLNRHAWSKRQMSWSAAKKAIDDFLQHSGNCETPSITFYGGEPLLNLPLIRKCVGYARAIETDRKILFALTINGSLLMGKTADFLAEEDFNIMLSLDGPREIHDRYRHTKDGLPTWDCIISNMKTFIKKHPEYKTNSKLKFNVIMAPPLDVSDLDKFFSSCNLLPDEWELRAGFIHKKGLTHSLNGNLSGLDAMYSTFVDNLTSGKISNDPSAPVYRLQKALYEQDWLMFHKRFEMFGFQHGRRCLPEKYCGLSTCFPGVRRTFVSVDGDYWPCERVPESSYFKIGNVEKGFDASRITQLLEEWVGFTKDQCRFCWCLRTCQIGCWSNVSDGTKTTALLKTEACEEHRKKMHKMIVEYCGVLEKNPHALDYMKDIEIK